MVVGGGSGGSSGGGSVVYAAGGGVVYAAAPAHHTGSGTDTPTPILLNLPPGLHVSHDQSKLKHHVLLSCAVVFICHYGILYC